MASAENVPKKGFKAKTMALAKKIGKKITAPIRRRRKALKERDEHFRAQAERIKRGEIKNIYDK